MQDLLSLLPLDMDAFGLSLATGLAGAIVFALKSLFALARKMARKTPTTVDDKIIDKTEAALRDKSCNL